MTAQLGFGEVFGHMRGVWVLCREGQTVGQQTNGRSWERSTETRKKRQLTTDARFMKTCRCNAQDAMRWNARHEQNAKQKTKPNHGGNNILHLRKRQELELRIWKVVSGALHRGQQTEAHPMIRRQVHLHAPTWSRRRATHILCYFT